MWERRSSAVMMILGVIILVPAVAAYHSLGTQKTSGAVGGLTALSGVLGRIAIIAALILAASLIAAKTSL